MHPQDPQEVHLLSPNIYSGEKSFFGNMSFPLKIHPEMDSNNNSDNSMNAINNNNNNNINNSNNSSLLSNSTPYRRARAETFSSFPSKLMVPDLSFFSPLDNGLDNGNTSVGMGSVMDQLSYHPQLLSAAPGVGGGGGLNVNVGTNGARVRSGSGSMLLPAADLTSPFGPSMFNSTWQPALADSISAFRNPRGGLPGSPGAVSASIATPISPLAPLGSNVGGGAGGVVDTEQEEFAGLNLRNRDDDITRTLDYLSLEDLSSDGMNTNTNNSRTKGISRHQRSISYANPYFGSSGNSSIISNNFNKSNGGSVSAGPDAPLGFGLNGISINNNIGGSGGGMGVGPTLFLSPNASSPKIQVLDTASTQQSQQQQLNSAFPVSPNSSRGIGGAIHSRFRSYSVTNGAEATGSGFVRPRSTSFGFFESGSGSGIGADIFGVDGGANVNDEFLGESNFFGSEDQTPSRTLWIGNLDSSISPASLLSVFSPFGPVDSLQLKPDQQCAFLTFVKLEDAMIAKDDMQGVRIGANCISLGYWKIESSPTAGWFDGAGLRQPSKSLWIGNLPPSTTSEDLEAIFRVYGHIESAQVLMPNNCGYVNFERAEDAVDARYAMNGVELGGYNIKVGFAGVHGSTSPSSGVTSTLHSPQSQQQRYTSQPMMGLGGQYDSVLGSPIWGFQSGIDNGRPRSLSSSSSNPVNNPVMGNAFPFGSSQSSSTVSSPLQPLTQGYGPDVPGNVSYAPSLLPLPEPNPNRRVDQNRLREIRKRLEAHPSAKDVDMFFQETYPDTVDLCTDYIGNIVLQKIIEKGTENHLLHMLEIIAPHMAAIGVHKNGTWVVQKMVDSAKTPAQMAVIVQALLPFTPPLLLDQFGNYVIQCCLRLGTQRNQFIFDAMHSKCWEIAQGRFGARAMRTCLESQFTTKRQQKHVAIAVVQNAAQLLTNPNGTLLITWLLDASQLPGRYRVLAPNLVPHMAALCCHKLTSSTILKLVNQRMEMDARDLIVKEIFRRDDVALREVLGDLTLGVTFIQKLLATGCISVDERIYLADRVRSVLSRMEVKESQSSYKRLLDELAVIPSNLYNSNHGSVMESNKSPAGSQGDEPVSPLEPSHPLSESKEKSLSTAVTASGNVVYPTPNNSPQPLGGANRIGGNIIGVALQNQTFAPQGQGHGGGSRRGFVPHSLHQTPVRGGHITHFNPSS